jgi:hypothetical protein
MRAHVTVKVETGWRLAANPSSWGMLLASFWKDDPLIFDGTVLENLDCKLTELEGLDLSQVTREHWHKWTDYSDLEA